MTIEQKREDFIMRLEEAKNKVRATPISDEFKQKYIKNFEDLKDRADIVILKT